MSFFTLVFAVLAFAVLWAVMMAEMRKKSRQQRAALMSLGSRDTYERLSDYEPFDKYLIISNVILFLLAWGAYILGEWWGWWGVFGTLSALLLFATFYPFLLNFEGVVARFKPSRRKAAVGGTILIAAAAVLFCARADWLARLAEEEHIRAEKARVAAEKTAAKTFVRHRRPWRPGRGVAEGAAGPMLGWLAVETYISIDRDYERELEAKKGASRQIPIKVVLLNNSFEDAPLDTATQGKAAAGGQRLWRVWVTRGGSTVVLREFTGAAMESRTVFMPTERADFTIDWDGRDVGGSLVPEGSYEVHLLSAPLAATGARIDARVEFRIKDEGPRVVSRSEPDPAVEWPTSMLKRHRLFDEMNRTSIIQRQFQSLQRQMQRLSR